MMDPSTKRSASRLLGRPFSRAMEVADMAIIQVTGADVLRQRKTPPSGDAGYIPGRDQREVIAVEVVGGGGGHGRVGLVLRDSVDVEHAAAQVDAVAGDAAHALDQDVFAAVGLENGLEEYDRLAAAQLAGGDKTRPGGGRR